MPIAAKFTENELLLLLQQKDENIVSYLYDTYAPLIYGLVLRELKNENISSEILKNAFIRISKECNKTNCTKHLFAWVWSLTQKTAQLDFSISLQLRVLPNTGNSIKTGSYNSESCSSYPFTSYNPLN